MPPLDNLSSPLHENKGNLLESPEGESPMQRSAMPPPFQLAENSGDGSGGESEESEAAQLQSMGGGSGLVGMPMPPPATAGVGGVLQREVAPGGGEQPLSSSRWAEKPARVSTEGYRIRSGRDSSLEPIGQLAFNTWVYVEQEWPGDWLEVITQTGVHGFVGIPNANLTQLPAEDQSANLHLVASGESAIGIAEQYYSQHVRQGMDLRFFVAVIAQLNGISIPDSVGGWRDTQVDAGEVLFMPSIFYITSQEGLVNTGSYTQETIDFVTETAELIQRVTRDVLASAEIAGTIISEGWMDAVIDGVQGAIGDKIRELLRRLLIVAGTTAVGALVGFLVGGVGAAPGAALGYELGLMIVNGIEFIEMIASIATIMETFATALASYAQLCIAADGNEETIQEAGEVLGQAVLFAIQILVEELVDSKVLSPDGPSTTDGPDSTGGPSTTDSSGPDTTTDRPAENETASPESTSGNTTARPDRPVINSEIESRTDTAGFRQATEMRLPRAPEGYRWVAGPDIPYIRREAGNNGPQRQYDPVTGTITDVPSSEIAHRAAIEDGSRSTVNHSELSGESLSRLDELEAQRNEAMADRESAEPGTQEYNQAMERIRNASEAIGMEAAEAAFMSQNPGAVKLDFAPLLGTSSGVFDLVFNVDGRIHILEVKGGTSPTLGTRNTADGRAQQGTAAYRDSIINNMRTRLISIAENAANSGSMATFELAQAQLANLNLIDQNASYLLAHQSIDSRGNVSNTISFSTFDTSTSE